MCSKSTSRRSRSISRSSPVRRRRSGLTTANSPDRCCARESATGLRKTLYQRWTAGWLGEEREREFSQRRTRKLAAVLVLSYGICYSLIGIDMIMSLAPEWVSTMFPAYFSWGGFLSSISLCTLICIVLRNSPDMPEGFLTKNRMHDLGKAIFAFSIIGGPALAASLYFAVGPMLAMLINAVSYLVSAFCLARLRAPQAALRPYASKQDEKGESGIGGVLRELFAGLKFVVVTRIVLMVTLMALIAMLGAGALSALNIVFVSKNLHMATAFYGVVTAVSGLGGLLGIILAGILSRWIAPRHILSGSALLIGVGFAIYSFQNWYVAGLVICFLMMIRVSGNDGWLISYQAVRGTRGRYASLGRNFSLFGLTWMTEDGWSDSDGHQHWGRIIRHRTAIWQRVGVGTGTGLPVWRCSMKLVDFAFGRIRVDGTVYEHDLVHRLRRWVLRRLRTHAAMCSLGIDKLRQHPAAILLLRRHAEQNALRAHVPVESLDVRDSETQFDLSCRIFVRRRVQRESSFARRELAPAR